MSKIEFKNTIETLRALSEKEVAVLSNRISANTTMSDSGCLEWTGARRGDGYGHTRVKDQFVATHRITAFLAFGEAALSDGRVVDHTCKNLICCNPEHLKSVTTTENNRLRFDKSRMSNVIYLTSRQYRERRKTAQDSKPVSP